MSFDDFDQFSILYVHEYTVHMLLHDASKHLRISEGRVTIKDRLYVVLYVCVTSILGSHSGG